MEAAVFRNRNSHVCLVFAQTKEVVQYVSTEEGNGELKTDTHRMAAREFHHEFKELHDYPVRRAVEHYLNPLTSAIAITERAQKVLTQMNTNKAIALNDEKKTLTLAERNIEATRKAGIKNTGSKLDVAAVAVVELIPGSTKKPTKGTWDKKVSPTEDNRDATKQAVRHHNEAKAKAVKKAAQKAARLERKKQMSDANENTTTENTEAPAQQKPVSKKPAAKKAPAKKAAAKKPEAAKAPVEKPAASKPAASTKPVAKKAAASKKTTTAPADKASQEKTVKNDAKKTAKTAAKKTVKTTDKKAPAKKAAAKKAPAKKLAKGTGKAPAKKAAPASKKASKAAAADGARRGRKSSFDEGQKIKVLVKDNPKREGTASYDTFELLKKSKTVGDFFAAGGGSANLHWNIERGYIEVN